MESTDRIGDSLKSIGSGKASEDTSFIEPLPLKPLFIKETSENLFFTLDAYLSHGKTLSYKALSEQFQAIPRHKRAFEAAQILDPIRYIHSFARLDTVQLHLSKRERRELEANSAALMEQLPDNLKEEYDLQIQLLDFANLLIGKYGLTATDYYNYRTRGRGLLVQCIDLLQLNQRVVSVDSLWLAATLSTGSFRKVASQRTMQLSKFFTTYAARTLSFLMEADSKTSWRQPCTYSILFWKTWNVKTYLKDLQQSHRAFEKSLIEDIIRLSALN